MITSKTKYSLQKKLSFHNSHNTFFQPKLSINDPNDGYEKEADEMADKVMRMQQPFIQPKPLPINSIHRKCANCEEVEKKAHRKEMNGNEATADHTLESYVGNLNGSGQSLTGEVRNFYEPRFGYDFSNVKVHTDSVAAKSAQSINAMAYTSGENIVFNSGQYSPSTENGKRLLGHELTHVIQQGASLVNGGNIQKRVTDEEDVVQRKPTPPAPPPFLKAIAAVGHMANFKNTENIIFDYWAGDCRDNNKNNKTDDDDRRERDESDGVHYKGTYKGFKTTAGYNCRGGWGGALVVPVDANITSEVKYRVCADLISQAYEKAGIGMHHMRTVAGIISFFKKSKHCKFWEFASFPGPYLPGDLLCSFNGSHGHTAMVASPAPASMDPVVIHLPGQSQLLKMGIYDPTVTNDVRIEPWWPSRPKYGVGRYIG